MTELVKIKEIEGSRVLCTCTTSACKSCSGSGFCNIKIREIEVRNPKGLEIHPGNTIEIYLPPGKTIFAGFMVMIFPLILFGLFFMITGKIFPGTGEGIRVLAGVAGIAVGFLTSWGYSRITNSRNIPEIIKVTDQE